MSLFISGDQTSSNVPNSVVRRDNNGAISVATLEVASGDATVYGITVGRGAGAISTNTAAGASALAANTTGQYNTVFGNGTGKAITTGQQNSFFGYQSGFKTTGGDNTGIGSIALYQNTTGVSNVAIGRSALENNTTASSNTAVGYQSLYSNSTSSTNTAVGYQAGYNSTASGQTLIGASAGSGVTTGLDNTAVGRNTMQAAVTGNGNIAVGARSLAALTSGAGNVAVGAYVDGVTYGALFNLTTGSYNVGIGTYAGGGLTTGGTNTFVGYLSGASMTTGSKNTIIGGYSGNQGGLDIRTASNYIVLSDGDGNPRLISDASGNVGIGITSPNARLQLNVARTSGTNASALILSDNVTGTQTTGYGTTIQGWSNNGNAISTINFEAYGGTNNDTAIGFYTQSVAGGLARRMTITSSGGVSIGTIADPGAGAIYATGNITAYYSDARLKTVSGTIDNALDKVVKLKGIYYTNNDIAKQNGYISNEVQVGVLAQDVEAILPEIVKAAPFDLDQDGNSKSGKNYKTVQYERLVPLLIEAIKELKAEIEILKRIK